MSLLTAPGFHDEGFVIQLIVNATLIFAGKLYQILKKSHLREWSLVPESMGLGTFIWEAHDLLMNLGSYTSALNKCSPCCNI